jgi:biotin operon repressor
MRRQPPHTIDLEDDDAVFLLNLIRDGDTAQRVARRARVLLAMADPATIVQELAQRLDLSRAAIWDLCRRYERLGVAVVVDAPRTGRPREISPPWCVSRLSNWPAALPPALVCI